MTVGPTLNPSEKGVLSLRSAAGRCRAAVLFNLRLRRRGRQNADDTPPLQIADIES